MGAKQSLDIQDFPGMVAVSERAFFAVVGKLDVHPSVIHSDRYDRIFGYVSTWTLRSGVVIGKHAGGTPFSYDLYMVTAGFYASNKAKFEDQPLESKQPVPATQGAAHHAEIAMVTTAGYAGDQAQGDLF